LKWSRIAQYSKRVVVVIGMESEAHLLQLLFRRLGNEIG
jgi:hypothetical protein